jgi:hypothetical protein
MWVRLLSRNPVRRHQTVSKTCRKKRQIETDAYSVNLLVK